jgi:phage shock protein A
MGQFVKRFMNVLRGKGNSVLEKLEKPEEQLSVFIDELNGQISGLQKSVAAAMADEKRLKMQLDDLLEKSNQWEAKAVLALKGGDENLAREALLQKEECLQQSEPIQKAWVAQKDATSKLRQSLSQAKGRVEEAKRKYTLLVARYKTAETNKKLTQTLSSTHDNSAQQMMERLSDRIALIESEAEAHLDMAGDCSSAELEAKFAQLEKKQRGDDALSQLKQKLAAEQKTVSPA